jgi:glycosyltransferase involved in cell wall biosynthesis
MGIFAAMAKPKVIVVMPAYNASRTLARTVADIPAGSADEIIVVDDASNDDTAAIARSLGLTTIVHAENRGYGANQKTCYDAALEHGADIVAMIHPDYQYDGRLLPEFCGFLQKDVCDVMLGSRIRTRREALSCGMPRYKYFANRMLTIIENVLTGQNLSEWHTGYRVYKREVLETIPYHANSDNFVFDSEFLLQAVHFGFRIGDGPVPVRYFAEASSINVLHSVKYGLQTLRAVLQFRAQGLGLHSRLFKRNGGGNAQR